MPTFDGLPLHPLVVHAPIALVPAAWAALLAYTVRPAWRRRLAPWLVALALLAGATTVAAAWSGDQLADVLDIGDRIDRHRTFGELTRAATLASALGSILVVAVARRRGAPDGPADGATTVAAAVVTAVATVAIAALAITGHAGATATWQERTAAATGDAVAPTTGEGSVTAPSEDPTSGPALEVTLGEWDLVLSSTEVRPGTYSVRFRNAGAVSHALRLRSEGDGARREWRSDPVPPGGTGELIVELAAGTYTLDCPVEGLEGEHDALGMERPLRVHAAAEDATSAPHDDDLVVVRAFAYDPPEVTVATGTVVTWENRDDAAHTATGEGWTTATLRRGDRAQIRFTEPGRHPYRCDLHSSMTGVVTVTH